MVITALLLLFVSTSTTTVSSFAIISRSAASTTPASSSRALSSFFNKHSVHKSDNEQEEKQHHNDVISLPQRAIKIYSDYASRLWNETSTEARKRVANDQATTAIRRVQHLLQGEEYTDFSSEISEEARKNLLETCDIMLAVTAKKKKKKRRDTVGKVEATSASMITTTTTTTTTNGATNGVAGTGAANGAGANGAAANGATNGAVHQDHSILPTHHTTQAIGATTTITPLASTSSSKTMTTTTTTSSNTDNNNNNATAAKKKKPRRSILFGAVMGFCVACWVFSGNYVFTGLFTLMTILGQLEYYRMVMNTGVYAARRMAVIGASTMFLTALFAPNLHQICLPLFGLGAIIQFLLCRTQNPSIADIAATFTGMFYLGYVPSFWVRIRLIGAGREPTRLAPIAGPMLAFLGQKAETSLPSFLPKAVHLPITTGAIFIFWTWISLAFSDVGAYFVGRTFGKTKLGKLAPAAGATSPNKSIEGVIGGCASAAFFSVIGAWVQKWPFWFVTGAIHGVILGLLGLIGDLTASMLKRDAGLKDFGDLIPEHGGILDRVDSFVWTAPYSWVVCSYIIPALKAFSR